MKEVPMDRIDLDYAKYTRGEISRRELYKRWKKRHEIGLVKALLYDFRDDLLGISNDVRAIFGR